MQPTADMIHGVVRERSVTPERWREICRLLHETRSVEYAMDRAQEQAALAKKQLYLFPPSAARDALMAPARLHPRPRPDRSWTPTRRIEELRRQIRHHEERYYVDSDRRNIRRRVRLRCCASSRTSSANTPISSPLDSPTQRVGGRTAEGFASVQHAEPMLSLDNAYNEEELKAFDERLRRGLDNFEGPVPYVAELKIDGLSIACNTATARSSAPPRGATARPARTSRPTSGRSRTSRTP